MHILVAILLLDVVAATEVNVGQTECTLCEILGIVKDIRLTQTKLEERTKVKEIVAKDCADLYISGVRLSGVYEIFTRDQQGAFEVYCDMTTDGGGWTVYQQRMDGSVDFYRGWDSYKQGFGNLNGEFYLGNDYINRLTNQDRYSLRIDLEDTSGTNVYASYDSFSVTAERTNYQLSIGPYHGNAGDSLSAHNGSPFSTKDKDNDSYGSNCAVMFKGAWWYKSCHASNLNGLYHHGAHGSFADGINWKSFKGYHYSLKRTSMKIRPVGFKSSQ